MLYLNFDGSDFQFVVALDKKTGRTAWKVNRSVDFQDLDAAGRPSADGDFRKGFRRRISFLRTAGRFC